MFQTKVVEKIKTQFSITHLFRKPCCLWDKEKKHIIGVRHGTDEKRIGRMRIALWVTNATDTQLGICNTYCFATSTMVTRSPLIVTFRTFPVFFCASACNTDTKNNTTNLIIQQNSRKLLMMDILMSETCWAHKKWNKIASDIKLVLYSSTISCVVFLWFQPSDVESVPASQNLRSVIVVRMQQSMLYREIIAVCSGIHTKHINTLCGHNVVFMNV